MAAVIRIKRHLNEDPLDAVLLNCKKRKTDDANGQEVDLSAVLKFAGTVADPQEDVFKHIRKPTKAETEDQFKKRTPDIIKKLRLENQESSKSNRYKVVNSFRSNESSLMEENAASDLNCTIVDIETSDTKVDTNVVDKESNSSKQKFVYDLYYTNSDDLGDADLNELISVYPLSDGVIYGTQYDDKCNDESDNDSEDSNAENNWRNDYPDESDVESPIEQDDNDSVTEADMLRAMNRVGLDDDLSSDDYEEAFGYEREEDSGRNYSRFKEKMQKQMSEDFCYYDDYDDSCTP
ncbi:hypothetical protein ILUMI_25411 [Ignelater luminosus]|uniref:Probable RNA polymerase II nuclear localization protein SLC7A6OS n=1 Tax=Ignelater luminosus TaxID=2038154 RepID=A0A8K0C4U3_IGNLU|nr:hypothetical protein ILUMI_25411 [Ignelater luminosus]